MKGRKVFRSIASIGNLSAAIAGSAAAQQTIDSTYSRIIRELMPVVEMGITGKLCDGSERDR